MTRKPLPNYLRMHRKRAGLSQDDVAFLLGGRSGTRISRYERFRCRPTLDTALAFEAVYRVPAHQLFSGLRDRIRQDVGRRAQTLAARLKDHSKHDRKVQHLRAIAGNPTEDFRHEPDRRG
jgi:transcriptional regulator with XRE-family HTH domain